MMASPTGRGVSLPIAIAFFLVLCWPLARAQAPPNAVPFSSFDSFQGTWTGKCTQTGYVNPNTPNDLACGISLNEFFTYDFSVTLGPNRAYSFQTGTFSRIGQNESFTAARVNQTIYALSGSGSATLSDISNGGSQCVSVTWGDGTVSKFLATIVRSVPSTYGVYLEEGQRQFSQSSISQSTQNCPSYSNQPHYCDPSSNIYSYTCYAIITLPPTVV